MSTSKAGCAIFLAKKLEIIMAVESGKKSKSEIAEEFSVAKSMVSSIVKNKQKIFDASDTASFTPHHTECSKVDILASKYYINTTTM